MTVQETTTASTRQQRRLAYFSSLVGSAVEYYDFLIYTTAATLVFGPLFFPTDIPAVSLLVSLSTLAAGYLARPLGGIVFGHFGDRVSRKTALIATIVIMGVATVGIGLLPTYATAGVVAPILLVALRIAQGIAVGGEYGGGVLMTVEHASDGRRGLMGSATALGSSIGSILSFGAFALLAGLDDESFRTWGWRLPFLATVVLLALGLVMRLKLEESPLMVEQREHDEQVPTLPPAVAVFRWNAALVLLAIGLPIGPFVAQAVRSTVVVNYAITTVGVGRQAMLLLVTFGAVGYLVTIPFFGWLSDRVGRKPIYIGALVLSAATAFLVFPLVDTGSWWLIVLVYTLTGSVLHGALAAMVPTILAETFPTGMRYTGVSIAYQGSAVVVGFAPAVAAALLVPGGPGTLGVAVLLAGGMLLSLVCMLLMRETRSADLRRIAS